MIDYATAIIKRLAQAVTFAGDKANDRAAIVEHLRAVVQWLSDDRSMQEHRMCFAFMQYLHESWSDNPDDFEVFRAQLLADVGHATIKRTDMTGADGTVTRFEMVVPKSLAFGQCGQKEFRAVFERIKAHARARGIDFEAWERSI